MNLTAFELSVWVLVLLANIAVASLVVCGAALVARRLLDEYRLPLQHALLVSALTVTLASPLVVSVLGACGVSLIHIPTPHSDPPPTVLTNLPMPTTERSVPLPAAALAPLQAANTTANTAPAVEPAPVSPPRQSPAARTHWSWSWAGVGTALAIAWAIGIVLNLGLLAVGLLRTRRLLRRVRPAGDASLAIAAAEAARDLGLAGVPAIYESDWVGAPLSAGLFRPRVIVPAGMLAALPADRLRGLLMHELAHVARGDHYIGLLQRLALAAYWWNPLVWRTSALTSALREQICDDLAAGRDEAADDYAAMLVELASRVVRGRPLPATIGMFEGSRREFRRRVERLLDHERPIATRLDRRMKLVAAACAAALLLLPGATTIRVESASAATDATTPNVQAKAAHDSAAEAPAVQWPTVLRGTIKDEADLPIAGARVRLDLEKIHEYSIGRWDETLSSQEMTTGADGEYRFDTAAFPVMTHRPFCLMMSVTADGYADVKRWMWYSRSDTSVDEKWHEVTLQPGRTVRGRVVSANGDPVPNAIIKAASDYDMNRSRSNWNWNPRKTDVDGNFAISVPLESEAAVELWVVHRDSAPQRVPVPKQGDVLADIRLQQGARVRGTVTREDGSPVAGTVVVARSIDDGTLEHVTFAVQLAVKTDADGRYQLPPLFGLYKIFLSQAAETDERLHRRFVVADVPPPLVVPAKVALSGSDAEQVDFVAGPMLAVSGTVRWADGRPAAGCEVRIGYMPTGIGTGVDLGETRTDAEGRYALELPRPIDGVFLNVIGAYDEKRQWHYAHPADDVDADRKSMQHINFDRLEGDRQGVDWVLRPRDWEGSPAPAHEKDAADLEFEKLKRQYAVLQDEYREALDAAANDEERQEVWLTGDPRTLLVDEYLNMEQRYRGTDVGLCALHQVERSAASVSDGITKITEAREEMIRRLAAHYMENEHLDLMLSSLNAGPRTDGVPEFLRRAAAESPHRHVQAAALTYLAVYRQTFTEAAANIDTTISELDRQPQSNQRWLETRKADAETLRTVDVEASRQEVKALCERVVAEYPGVTAPRRLFSQAGRIIPSSPSTDLIVTDYSALAAGLLFDVEHLQVGMPAPAIEGTDRDGKPVRIDDFGGKVTVIAIVGMGNASTGPQIERILKQHKDEPLAVVTIRSDRGTGFEDRYVAPTGPRWTEIMEGIQGPLATRWAIRNWPTLFVVDHHGVIRARRLNELPMHLIGQLLKETDGTSPE